MASPRPPHRNGTERSRSFNGRGGVVTAESSSELRRPRTVPDLKATVEGGGGLVARKAALTKVLMKVSIQGSVGAVQVLISLDNTVGDLILAIVKQYIKEARRPTFSVKDVADFDLHYSQFTLECLDREEKLATLGSRNFFMCKRRKDVVADGGAATTSTSSTCSSQAEKVAKLGSPCPWLKFISFLF